MPAGDTARALQRYPANWHPWDDEDSLVVPAHPRLSASQRPQWTQGADVEALLSVSTALPDARNVLRQTADLSITQRGCVFSTPIAKRNIEYYRAIADIERTTLLVPPAARCDRQSL